MHAEKTMGNYLKNESAWKGQNESGDTKYTQNKTACQDQTNSSKLTKITLKTTPTIFISHSSIDKKVAEILMEFLCATGISRDQFFCSSISGNGVMCNISTEIKNALDNSSVNIVILSKNYYQSAYCLNEAGIIWYKNSSVPIVTIALPEITPENMRGFINNEYILRRLDSVDDISWVYDLIYTTLSLQRTNSPTLAAEASKLKEKYEKFLKSIKSLELKTTSLPTVDILELTTDDERILLYYILQKNIRRIPKNDVLAWLQENEIYNVNVDNAFDLLSSFDDGTVKDDMLELGINTFRKYSKNKDDIIPILKNYVDQHTKHAVDSFNELWKSNRLEEIVKLFILYIIEKQIIKFGSRWMAKKQIENIEEWEIQNNLFPTLSEQYEYCLQFFIKNNFVYETSWTEFENPREYTLHSSLQKFLSECPQEYIEELHTTKKTYNFDIPF